MLRSLVLAASLAFASLLPLPAQAQETRTITDDMGFEVTFPAEPLRIVSLHDWTATVMAYELGANLIGSSGRLADDGSYFIRSGRELYNLEFGKIALASVHGELNMETIAALKPDLIIGNVGDTADYREQLALIAPTIMFDPMNGMLPIDQYREFAGWLGKDAVFEEKLAAYQARIAVVKAKLLPNGETPSYSAFMVNAEDGELRVFRQYGAQTMVLDDLGFTRAPLVATIPDGQMDATFSAEVIGELNTDYIFSSYIGDRGETPDSVLTDLDQVAPGARDFLKAVKNGHVISMDRFYVYPTTFASFDYVLDQLELLVK